MGKKVDLSDFECGIVGARRAALEYFRNCSSTGIFHKKRKYPVSSSCLGKNALLMPDVRGEWPDSFKLLQPRYAEEHL